jgi:hypothetical protein
MSIADKIHGYPVLAWVQTEIQSTGPCGIVLVKVREASDLIKDSYCVAWYRQGDREWSSGHYLFDLEEAQEAFMKRCKRNGFGRYSND